MLDLNAVLEGIRRGSGYPMITLSGQKVSTAQLGQIVAAATNKGYTGLAVSNCSLTPAHIDLLKGSSFTTLIADNNATLGSEGGKRVAALSQLTTVDLSYCNAGGQLSGFKNGSLNNLVIRGGGAGGVTLNDITALMANPHLKQINLSGNRLNFDNAGCKIVAANKNLTHVNLRGCNALDDTAALLEQNGNLRSLDLSNCRNLTKSGMESVGRIGALTHLSLVGVSVSAGPAALNKNLQVVDLNYNYSLGDAGFAAFGQLKNLTSISLFSCGLTDKSVDLMLKMPNLTYVEIGDNPVSYSKKVELQAHVQNNINRLGQNVTSGLASFVTAKHSAAINNAFEEDNGAEEDNVQGEWKHLSEEEKVRPNPQHVILAASKGKPGFWKQHTQAIVDAAEVKSFNTMSNQ